MCVRECAVCSVPGRRCNLIAPFQCTSVNSPSAVMRRTLKMVQQPLEGLTPPPGRLRRKSQTDRKTTWLKFASIFHFGAKMGRLEECCGGSGRERPDSEEKKSLFPFVHSCIDRSGKGDNATVYWGSTVSPVPRRWRWYKKFGQWHRPQRPEINLMKKFITKKQIKQK